MRIIAGKFRGRKIKTLKGLRLRPTGAKVREALFNILGETVQGARVLDLFAGSGALGLEALSRGAREVVFVDNFLPACRILEENILALGVGSSSRVICLDCRRAVRRLAREGGSFDLVLADPPYRRLGEPVFPARREKQNILREIEAYGILAPAGFFILEHFSRSPVANPPGSWTLVRRAGYGQSALTFFASLK